MTTSRNECPRARGARRGIRPFEHRGRKHKLADKSRVIKPGQPRSHVRCDDGRLDIVGCASEIAAERALDPLLEAPLGRVREPGERTTEGLIEDATRDRGSGEAERNLDCEKAKAAAQRSKHRKLRSWTAPPRRSCRGFRWAVRDDRMWCRQAYPRLGSRRRDGRGG